MDELFLFEVGEHVEKFTGDYQAHGVVVSCFYVQPESKRHARYVVRHLANQYGYILHIYSAGNLRSIDRERANAKQIQETIGLKDDGSQPPIREEEWDPSGGGQGVRRHGASIEELQKGGQHEETLTQKELAAGQGFTGDCCVICHNFTMKRNGPCLLCQTCGHTTGCT